MKRARALAGLAVVSVVLLTGCGAVPDLNPGVAARVGDTTLSDGEVADTAATYCSAVETQLQQGDAITNARVNREVAGSLALRAAAEEFAADEGLQAGADYEQAKAQLEPSLGELSDAQKEAVREVNLASPYASSVLVAYGRQHGASSDQDALREGQQAFDAWLDDHDVTINPRYGVSFEDGAVSTADTSLSYAVSDTAKRAGADQDDATQVGRLPSSQRCG